MGHHASGQGDVGFNTYAEKGLGDVMRFWETNNCRQNADLEEYQQAAAAACHPSSPIRRLLVDYRMGAGKTKFILQILDFHFEEERKKVPVFPMQPAIDNLFDEMLKWPGKYRSYFALVQPLWAAKAVPLRLSASEQEGNLENEVLRKRLDAGLCINRHKWSNKSVPSIQTMVWEGPKKRVTTARRKATARRYTI